MKNIFAILIALSMISLNACIIDVDDDFDGPPCEYNYTGTVCFVNYTDSNIEINTGGFRLDVWAFSDQCVELGSGYYEFVGLDGYQVWDGGYDVFVCERSNVYLDY